MWNSVARYLVALNMTIGLGLCAAHAKSPYGLVVRSELEKQSSDKYGVQALTETGRELFGYALLTSKSSGTGSYGGVGVPQWARITWRENVTPGLYWSTGTVVGDYKIEVASRIPAEVYTYASQGKGRSIRLTFRIKDDGVLLAWSVEEKYAGGFFQSLWGGDFPCDPPTEYMLSQGISNRCISGNLTEQPWYRAEWHGQ